MGKKSNKAKIRIIKTRINEIINNSKSKGETYDSPILIPEMKQYFHDNIIIANNISDGHIFKQELYKFNYKGR